RSTRVQDELLRWRRIPGRGVPAGRLLTDQNRARTRWQTPGRAHRPGRHRPREQVEPRQVDVRLRGHLDGWCALLLETEQVLRRDVSRAAASEDPFRALAKGERAKEQLPGRPRERERFPIPRDAVVEEDDGEAVHRA